MLNPSFAGATYGNAVSNGTSFALTPSPSGRLLRLAAHQAEQDPADHAQLDVDHVVTEPAAVREARGVALDLAERLGAGRDRGGQVQPQQVGAAVLPVELFASPSAVIGRGR